MDRIAFKGAGIAYTARNVSASLAKQQDRQVLTFEIDGFDAEYGDSFTGRERAKGLNIELSVPTTSMSGQVLLALAYRLSGILLTETEVQEILAPPDQSGFCRRKLGADRSTLQRPPWASLASGRGGRR